MKIGVKLCYFPKCFLTASSKSFEYLSSLLTFRSVLSRSSRSSSSFASKFEICSDRTSFCVWRADRVSQKKNADEKLHLEKSKMKHKPIRAPSSDSIFPYWNPAAWFSFVVRLKSLADIETSSNASFCRLLSSNFLERKASRPLT